MSSRANGSNSVVRCLRYTTGGGYYQGMWLHGQHHGYGVKASGRGLIYEGQWRRGQRHGYGTLRRLFENGHAQRLYVGQWAANVRSGEGKQYYDDGSVYYGHWLNNERSGRGILWHADGRIYVGEWLKDVMHGRGVLYAGELKARSEREDNLSKLLSQSSRDTRSSHASRLLVPFLTLHILFTANGNRYVGEFAGGCKSGIGVYYHQSSEGQSVQQHGLWSDNICTASLMPLRNPTSSTKPSL